MPENSLYLEFLYFEQHVWILGILYKLICFLEQVFWFFGSTREYSVSLLSVYIYFIDLGSNDIPIVAHTSDTMVLPLVTTVSRNCDGCHAYATCSHGNCECVPGYHGDGHDCYSEQHGNEFVIYKIICPMKSEYFRFSFFSFRVSLLSLITLVIFL